MKNERIKSKPTKTATAVGATEWPSKASQDVLFPLVEINLA